MAACRAMKTLPARRAAVVAVAAAILFSLPAFARGGGHGQSGGHRFSTHSTGHSGKFEHAVSSHTSHSADHSAHHGRADPGIARDSHGHIARSSHAKERFRQSHPCPSTGKTYGGCPGYVIDHIQALKHGGADNPSNMQWQTRSEAKAKDRWE
jgi:hypothetical protein